MAAKWQQLSVEQIRAPDERSVAIGPFGSRMKADAYVDMGVPVIRGNNISDTQALTGDFVYVSEETADELRSCNVFPSDLVFPHRGAIGQVGIVPNDGVGRYMLSTSLMKLTCNRKLVDPEFVFYFFRSGVGRHALLRNASTVGTPGIGQPLTSLRAISVPVPALAEQRAIANILGTLDYKIELSRRMSETLEAMARALFKSWFVDFDPVRAKAEGRDPGLPKHVADLFPDRLVESELGEIPEGWTVCQLSDVTEYLSRGISPAYVETGGILVLNQKCVRDGQVDWVKGRRHDEQKKGTVNRRLKVGDVLVNSTGVGTLGRVAQVLWLPEDAVVDSHVTVVRAKTLEVSPAYLGMELRRRESEIEALGEGSTGQTELSRTRLSALMLIAPTASVLDCFSRIVAPLWSRVALAWRQSEVLSQIRDALLPKLVSGELRIGEAARIVEDAVA